MRKKNSIFILLMTFISFLGNANDECLNYNTISERDRAADYFSYHTMKCDANLPQAWYRFTGSAGTVMPTQCVPKMHCGTLSPGWLNGKHPSVGEGVVERMACFTKDDECCFWYSQVLVRNCSDFIVYRFGQFPTAQHFCSLRYCGTGRTGKFLIHQELGYDIKSRARTRLEKI